VKTRESKEWAKKTDGLHDFRASNPKTKSGLVTSSCEVRTPTTNLDLQNLVRRSLFRVSICLPNCENRYYHCKWEEWGESARSKIVSKEDAVHDFRVSNPKAKSGLQKLQPRTLSLIIIAICETIGILANRSVVVSSCRSSFSIGSCFSDHQACDV